MIRSGVFPARRSPSRPRVCACGAADQPRAGGPWVVRIGASAFVCLYSSISRRRCGQPVVSVHRVVHSRRRAHCPGWPTCAAVSEVERLIGRGEGEPVEDVGEARLRVHVDGARIHRALAHESSGPDSDHPGEALARVLEAWQANELR